jgi:hypothetical protein
MSKYYNEINPEFSANPYPFKNEDNNYQNGTQGHSRTDTNYQASTRAYSNIQNINNANGYDTEPSTKYMNKFYKEINSEYSINPYQVTNKEHNYEDNIIYQTSTLGYRRTDKNYQPATRAYINNEANGYDTEPSTKYAKNLYNEINPEFSIDPNPLPSQEMQFQPVPRAYSNDYVKNDARSLWDESIYGRNYMNKFHTEINSDFSDDPNPLPSQYISYYQGAFPSSGNMLFIYDLVANLF